jgi:hypothetical protein
MALKSRENYFGLPNINYVYNPNTMDWERMTQPLIDATNSNLYLALDTVETKLAAINTAQSDGTQKAKSVDGSGNLLGTTTNPIAIQPPASGSLVVKLTDGTDTANITTDGAVQVQDRYLAIAKGDVSGHSVLLKFGRNPDIDTNEETIWEGGGTYPFQSSAQSLEVLSSDANDTSAGTGARTITLIGQDANHVEQTQVITLNGTTPVAITGSWLRVYRCSVTTAGSGAVNAGTITVRIASAGATLLVVGAGNGQTLMAVYTTPAGYTGYMIRYYASLNTATPGTTVSMDVRLFTKPGGGVVNLKHQQASLSGFFQYNFGAPFKISEKTDIYLNASTSANNCDVCGGFDIILVAN